MDLLDAIAEGVQTPDERDGRIYGYVPGVVTSVEDPLGLCRIQARIAGQQPTDSTDWLVPELPGGIEAKPRKGDAVLIKFQDGDPNRGSWMWTLTTQTQNRCTDYMLLGTTFVGLYNDLIARFNQLRAAFIAHTHPGVSAGIATTSPTLEAVPANAIAGLAADGSQPAYTAGGNRVLSADIKVR